MASTGKKKSKGKTISLNEFHQMGDEQPVAIPVRSMRSWADEMENEDAIEAEAMANEARLTRSTLPTAPRASRGPEVDLAKVPSQPPFTAFIGNLPYDIKDADLHQFFRGLSIVHIRLMSEGGRMKGFGYVEFSDRHNLIEALSHNQGQLRTRNIRVDLVDDPQRDGQRNDRSQRDDKEDRTMGDWRKRDPAESSGPEPRDRPSFDRGGGSFDRERGGGLDRDRGGGFDSGRDRYDNRDRGGFDRDRGSFDRERGGFDRGFDRGGGGGFDRYDRRGGDDYGRHNDRDAGEYGNFRRRDGYYDDRRRGGDDRDRGGRRFGSGYRDGGGPPPARGGSEDRPRPDAERQYRRPSSPVRNGPASPPRERKKLVLAPRSKPISDKEEGKPSTAAAASSAIFGSAKPVDTASKEKEIEEKLKQQQTHPKERLQRQKAADQERLEQEREQRERLHSSTSSRSRRDSQHSDDDANRPRRERKSSSNSGKGGRVIPPPAVGQPRMRRESSQNISDDDVDVFDGPCSPKNVSVKFKDKDAKLVPAPPPKENIWEKRKTQNTSPGQREISLQTSPTRSRPDSMADDVILERPEEKDEGTQTSPSTPPEEHPVEKGSESAWARNKDKPHVNGRDDVRDERMEDYDKRTRRDDNERGRGRSSGGRGYRGGPSPARGGRGGGGRGVGGSGDRGRGGVSRGGGRWAEGPPRDAPKGGDVPQRLGNVSSPEPRKEREPRPLPKSIEDMPKLEVKQEKDFSDRNIFSSLMDNEDEAAPESNQ